MILPIINLLDLLDNTPKKNTPNENLDFLVLIKNFDKEFSSLNNKKLENELKFIKKHDTKFPIKNKINITSLLLNKPKVHLNKVHRKNKKITDTLLRENIIGALKVEEIKNILISKAKSDFKINILVNSKEFKKVSSLKELIHIAQKFELNLTKIIIDTKQNNNTKQIDFIKTIIESKATINHKVFSNKVKITNNKLINNKIDKPHRKVNKLHTKLLMPKKKVEDSIKEVEIKNIEIKNVVNKIRSNEKEVNLASLLNAKKEFKETKKDNPFVFAHHNEFKTKIITSKQSLTHFVSSLQDAIQNYKPPVTKLSIQLHPKEIGKIKITMKQQGDNLNIQINTNNSTAINFLSSQQQEIKSALVAMGFSNINMNFNDNSKKQKEQNFYKSEVFLEEEDMPIIEFNYKYA